MRMKKEVTSLMAETTMNSPEVVACVICPRCLAVNTVSNLNVIPPPCSCELNDGDLIIVKMPKEVIRLAER